MTAWQKLKNRKIVQWALAYLAAAWVVVQVASLVGSQFGWPSWVLSALLVLAGAGLPLVLVLAWYHGEKGRQVVSGTEALIVVALLAVAGTGIYVVAANPPDEDEGRLEHPVAERSVAVLPLDDMSPGEDHAHFAAAMTEEITSALSQVPGLNVTSRNSASKFPGSGMTVSEFARRLGVAYVIEGSVQRSGDRARITVQLIDARADEQTWTATYDRTLTGLFEVQVDVARKVAERLAVTFTERERERILAGATDDPVAYDLMLQAGASALDLDERVRHLRRAVARDPDFWPAWERLAFSYMSKEERGKGARWADSSRAAFRRAIEAAAHPSVQLRLEAYRAVVFGGRNEEDVDHALARLRSAAEVRPSDLYLVETLAQLYRIRGRLPEAVRWRRQAALLDPLQSEHWQALFQMYWWVELYDRAERAIDRAVELEPGRSGLWESVFWLQMVQHRVDRALSAADSAEARGSKNAALLRGEAYWWVGDMTAAGAEYATVDPARVRDAPVYLLLPMAHTRFALGDSALGRRIVERARTVLDSRVIQDYEPEWRVYPRLQLAAIDGDVEKAVELFRRYVDRGGRDYSWFEDSPLFAELRTVPAFRSELEDLRQRVTAMRRRIEREVPELTTVRRRAAGVPGQTATPRRRTAPLDR